ISFARTGGHPVLLDDSSLNIATLAGPVIRRKVQQLVARAELSRQDRQDFAQDLLVRLLQRLPAFDPARGHLPAFIKIVVERCAANLLRSRRATKRETRRVGSLSLPAAATEGG